MTSKKQSKHSKNRLTTLFITIIIIATVTTAYNLLKFGVVGLILFIIELIGFIILFIIWHCSTYGYICRDCGYEFNVGIFKRGKKKKSTLGRLIRCPKCNSCDVIKERYIDDNIDRDED